MLCIVALVFSALSIIGASLIVGSGDFYGENPGLEDLIKDHAADALIVEVINIVMTIIAMAGAICFNMWMVSWSKTFLYCQ